MKYLKIMIICAAIIVSGENAQARDMAINSGINCTMMENVNMNISFNGFVANASEIKDIIDQKESKIRNIGKDIGIEEIAIQSQNFNINSNNSYGNGYQYSGNMSFQMYDYDKALLLLDKLKEEKYQVSLNANSYKQGNCQH